MTMESFDASPAIKLWWEGGKRSRRPGISPYGPHKNRKKKVTAADYWDYDTDSSSSDSDEQAEGD